MSLEVVKLIQGDTGPSIRLTLKDASTGEANDPDSWDPIDLSPAGTVVYAKARKKGATTILATTVCTVTDAANGKITYIPPAVIMDGDLGDYEVEIYADFNSIALQTMHNLLRMRLDDHFA